MLRDSLLKDSFLWDKKLYRKERGGVPAAFPAALRAEKAGENPPQAWRKEENGPPHTGRGDGAFY